MKFNTVNENSNLGEGFSLAKFKGVEEVMMPDGKKVYKLQFKLCVLKDNVPTEVEFRTGYIASSRENPGALSEQIVKQLCESVNVAYTPGFADIPTINEPLGAFDKIVKVYMKKKVGTENLNMAWQDKRLIWPPTFPPAGTKPQTSGYGI